MKKFLILVLISLPFLKETPVFSSDPKPGISNIQANARTIPLYEKFELSFLANGNWDNPFDPEQVSIDCLVFPPKGEAYLIPAFFFQDYHLLQTSGGERLETIGDPCWKVRLTPLVPGVHRYKLQMQNGRERFETEEYTFEATFNSSKPGFVRISEINPYYFEYENGKPYFIVGENMLAPDVASLNKWLTSLARAGGNFIRTWWCSSGIILESRVSEQPDQGLGKIRQDAAWMADYQIDLAEKVGVTVMACFETQQYLRTNVWWDQFTYNAANGGPVKTPAEYFSNEEAAKYFKRRLRYIVARWAYSTSIFSWQFWNEVNSANNFNVEEAAEWHREMSRYLRNIDPYNHIIHTNFGHLDGRQIIDALPETEVISTNTYSRRDMAQTAVWATRFMTSRYRKPYLLTEYGLGHQGGWAENDPKGIMVHNGLWGAALAGAAGSALPWGWGSWVDAQNMYHYFDTFSKTFRDITFQRYTWKPVEVDRFVFGDKKKSKYYANAFFEGFPRNYSFEVCPNPKPNIFTITPEGEVENAECFNAALFAGGKAESTLKNEPDDFSAAMAPHSKQILKINMPADGQLIVHIPELGANSNPILLVSVNEDEVLRKPLKQDNPNEAWAYFKSFPVALKAGNNEVIIANGQIATANLWQNVLYLAYEITNYRLLEGPDLDCTGLQSEDHIFLWLRNPGFTWMFDRMGREPEPQPAGILSLKNTSPGNYTIVWRDTITGEEIARSTVSNQKGVLRIPTPPVSKSVVAHLVKMN